MRIRIRGPTGQSILTFDDNITIGELRKQVSQNTGFDEFVVKYGYPTLRPLDFDQYDSTQTLTAAGLMLNGEQLIVTQLADDTSQAPSESTSTPGNGLCQIPLPNPTAPTSAPLSLTRKQNNDVESDPPEISSAEHSGTVVLRIMPDDNSCLFRAVGNAVIGGMDTMTELRSVIAQIIQAQPDVYSEVVLERNPNDYCRWIQGEDAWGGAIELGILSKYFDVEISSIDVQTLRIDRFNEGAPTRCIVVYSGIHYDTIALSPSDPPFTHAYAPPDFDTKIFDVTDSIILEKAVELCRILQSRHYYTDTAKFNIRCNTCGGMFVGEKGATEHATKTGHYDFGEAG